MKVIICDVSPWDEIRLEEVPRKYPMHDPLIEVVTPNVDRKGGFTAKEILLRRKLKKAFKGDDNALVYCLKRASRHEIQKIRDQPFCEDYREEWPNYEYEWLGKVAQLLDIAQPVAQPGSTDSPQRYELQDWVLDLAVDRGCRRGALMKVEQWKQDSCPQYRRSRFIDWCD